MMSEEEQMESTMILQQMIPALPVLPGTATTPTILTQVAVEAADNYLRIAGVSIDHVRDELVQAAAAQLEVSNRSGDERVQAVRMLSCVERVLCDRLGARPGSHTLDPDTARRRFLFAINPSREAQLGLLIRPSAQLDAVIEAGISRIPEIRQRVSMPRQRIDFRVLPYMDDWRSRTGIEAPR